MKLGEIASQFQLELSGDAEVNITGIASLSEADATQLAFLFNSNYRDQLQGSDAAAVVLRPGDAELTDKPCLISDNPRMAWAHIATL